MVAMARNCVRIMDGGYGSGRKMWADAMGDGDKWMGMLVDDGVEG